jgi:hypothetical protein
MPNIDLSIPARQPSSPANAAALHRPRLREWISQLPLMNRDETTKLLLDMLAQINRINTEPLNRFGLLDDLRPIAEQMHSALKRTHLGAGNPLNEKSLTSSKRAMELLRELGDGYKIIVTELSESDKQTQLTLQQSCVHAMDTLAAAIIEHYLVYAPDPEGIWHELHELYRYAESAGFAELPITIKRSDHDEQTSCQAIYLRIIMVALANPYHLMRGEADEIYRQMQDWLDLVGIAVAAPSDDLTGQVLVDLRSYRPPLTYSPHSQFDLQEPRVLDTMPLVEALSEEIAQIARTKSKSGKRGLSFMERSRRDFLVRIRSAWGGRPERRFQRTEERDTLMLAAGLTAGHYFISEDAEFDPEKDELRLKRAEDAPAPALSLVDNPKDAWGMEHQSTRLQLGLNRESSASFQIVDKDADIWSSNFETGITARAQMQPKPEPKKAPHETTRWRIKDRSLGGLAICSEDGNTTQLQVGEIVCYGEPGKPAPDWEIGVVRWMRRRGSRTTDIGIKNLAQTARPISVRAIAGTGKGADYTRSLLIPRANPKERPTGLLVPAAIFDLESVLLVNLGDDLIYAKLVDMLDTTKSFTHFLFEIVDPPREEGGKERFSDPYAKDIFSFR